MRLKFAIVVIFIAVVIVALLLLFHKKTQPLTPIAPTSFQEASQKSGNGLVTISTNVKSAPHVQTMAEDNTGGNAVQSRELQMKEAVEGQNVPVRFYGKVIDQDSNALSGVRVKLGVRHGVYVIPNSLESAKYAALSHEELEKILNPTTEVVSDSNGRFQWADSNITGDVLGVGFLRKDGYEAEPGQYSCKANSGNYADPVVFKMWSTNIHEKLITKNESFEIVPNGRSYFINLIDGTISESGGGDLKVWIQYTNQVVQGQLYDWSAGIEVLDGGLLEVPHGTVMYSAPKDGFTSSFSLQQQIKGGQSGEIGDRSFYLLLRNGQVYGKMNINLFAPYGRLHPGLIRISYAVNPSGSRILR